MPGHKPRSASTRHNVQLFSEPQLTGKAFPEGRQDVTKILLTGYVELLAQELPEKARIAGDVQIRRHRRSCRRCPRRFPKSPPNGGRRQAEFTRDLVFRRDTLVMQFRDLFKPEPKYYGRNPEGPDELRKLAKKKLTEAEVNDLIEKVTK